MIFLFNRKFRDCAREARSHNNLQSVDPGFRVNWQLYAEVLKARNLLGPATMQQMRFNQLMNHSAKTQGT